MIDPNEIISFDEDGSYYVSCWACGGAGYHEGDCTCWDDTCCCLYPEPPLCSECNGTGALGPIHPQDEPERTSRAGGEQ